MKKMLIIGGKLALIGAVAAVALALINNITAPRIQKQKDEALANALSEVAENGVAGEFMENKIGKMTGYYPIMNDNQISGYILRLTGDGYGGDLSILASYDTRGMVYKVKLMENQETPGLGKEAEKPEYMTVFENTGIDIPVPVWKSDLTEEQVDAITGASVTYYGVSQTVKEGSDLVKNGLEASNAF